jgi:hypothetical protein
MELKEYIRLELDGLEQNLKRVTDSLTRDEIGWRPACGCNSIGLILFHMVRGEDIFINGFLQNKAHVWESGKWAGKLNVPENLGGGRLTAEQVNTFPVLKLEDLMAYSTAVHMQTLAYLEALQPADFDKKVKLPFGEFSVAGVFALINGHTAQHIGEISYLRGLQRGMDK